MASETIPICSRLLLDNVVKTFGAVRAVDAEVSKHFPGQFIGVATRAQRCGKDDAVSVLCGLLAFRTAGRIEVIGAYMSRDAVPALARLGIVFHNLLLSRKTIRRCKPPFSTRPAWNTRGRRGRQRMRRASRLRLADMPWQ